MLEDRGDSIAHAFLLFGRFLFAKSSDRSISTDHTVGIADRWNAYDLACWLKEWQDEHGQYLMEDEDDSPRAVSICVSDQLV